MIEQRSSILWYAWFQLMRLGQVLLPVACAIVAARFLPVSWAATAGIVLALALSSFGAWLLLRSKVGEIGWRNHIAGWCLPWGAVLGQGRLPKIVISCSIVWAIVYWAALIIMITSSFSSAMHWALLFTWLVIIWCLQKVLGTLMQNYELSSRSGGNLLKIIGLMSVVLIASVVLQINGSTHYALLLAAAPIVVVGLPYGVFILSMLTFGRNARWN